MSEPDEYYDEPCEVVRAELTEYIDKGFHTVYDRLEEFEKLARSTKSDDALILHEKVLECEALYESMQTIQEELENISKEWTQTNDAIKSKHDELQKHLVEEKKEAEATVIKIQSLHDNASQNLAKISNTAEKIQYITKQYSEKEALLFSAIQDAQAVNTQVKILNSDSENINEKFKEAKQLLTQMDTELASIQGINTKIKTFERTSEESSQMINEILEKAGKTNLEITLLHKQIFGDDFKDETSGIVEHKKGIKDELESSYDQVQSNMIELTEKFQVFSDQKKEIFDDFMKISQENRDNILHEIKSHLDDSVTAGLAGAYFDKRTIEETSLWWTTIWFAVVVALMCIIACIPFGISFYWLNSEKTLEYVISKAPNTMLLVAPFYAPLIWIGIYLNKKLNLSKKLVEEYAYKEAICKTVTGLKQQIKALGDDEQHQKLHEELITLILKASADNPGRHINGHHKSDNPLMELTSSLADATKFLKENPSLKQTIDNIIQTKPE